MCRDMERERESLCREREIKRESVCVERYKVCVFREKERWRERECVCV